MKDYVKEWLCLGFGEEVKNFAERINLQLIENLVVSSFLTEKRKNAILRLIQRRFKEMNDAI